MSGEEEQRVLDINLGGVLNGDRAFVPLLIEHGRPAALVNVVSMAGFMASGDRAPYVMSKHAVVGLTEAIRCQLAELPPQYTPCWWRRARWLFRCSQPRRGRANSGPTRSRLNRSPPLPVSSAPWMQASSMCLPIVIRDPRIGARFDKIPAACRVTNELAAEGSPAGPTP
jgi:short chain dehydrogenase